MTGQAPQATGGTQRVKALDDVPLGELIKHCLEGTIATTRLEGGTVVEQLLSRPTTFHPVNKIVGYTVDKGKMATIAVRVFLRETRCIMNYPNFSGLVDWGGILHKCNARVAFGSSTAQIKGPHRPIL